MYFTSIYKFVPLLALLFFSDGTKNKLVLDPVKKAKEKTLYIPKNVWSIPQNNDYANDSSEYSNVRKRETANFALYWAKEYGVDPTSNPNVPLRFDPAVVLAELEMFYSYYVDKLKFVEKGHSKTDDYKMIFYIISGKSGGTAYGGGTEQKIGLLWSPSSRIGKKPYGALAHELGHSFQYMVSADGAWGFTGNTKGSFGQALFEMTSQFMLLQIYPEWMTFENYHLVNFMQRTHLAFLHEENRYSSPYVLEYWANKHGVDFIGKLWRNALKGEDAVTAYKRITKIDQKAFNDEIFDASRRFMTWDLKLMETAANKYANQHTTELNAVANGWYRIANKRCPQNYGYNGIKLNVPTAGTKVKLAFKGLAGDTAFRTINVDKAGWRYGFVAYKENGTREYSKTFDKANATVSFTVPADTKFLWLVVSGAPTVHWEHLWDDKVETDEQWPYQIKLTGTTLDGSVVK